MRIRNRGVHGDTPTPASRHAVLRGGGRSFRGGLLGAVPGRGPYREQMTFDRITVDPDLMGGVPTLRGLLLRAATVVSMVADGMSVPEILEDLPDLERDDVTQALRFAAESVRERQIPLLRPA